MATIVTEGSVRVTGLRDLRRELRKLDDQGFREGLKDAHFEVAGIVVDKARGIAGGLGRMQAKAAETLSPARQEAKAVVRYGGGGVPFAMGAEFGAGRDSQRIGHRGDSVFTYTGYRQFMPWRGNGTDAGYFLWPAIRGSSDQIMTTYTKAIDKLTSAAFPD